MTLLGSSSSLFYDDGLVNIEHGGREFEGVTYADPSNRLQIVSMRRFEPLFGQFPQTDFLLSSPHIGSKFEQLMSLEIGGSAYINKMGKIFGGGSSKYD